MVTQNSFGPGTPRYQHLNGRGTRPNRFSSVTTVVVVLLLLLQCSWPAHVVTVAKCQVGMWGRAKLGPIYILS